jgi:hypothetical protein
MKMTDRILHAWNAFTDKPASAYNYGYSSSRPTYRQNLFFNSGSYVSSIYNRIAMDVSMTSFKHVKVNSDNDDMSDMNTGLNQCLTVESNIDQTHIQFIQDLVYSMFDEGVVAVVPVDTTINPSLSGAFDVNSLRVGKIVNWFPKHVEVNLYNENTGQSERVFVEKKNVAIIENPLYAVVNDENSTLKRLVRKLNLLDNEEDAGRLDLLISVPYGIKTETQRKMAEKRIADIEAQLITGRHGISYIDGTEKVMQLNRPVNSQLPETINQLTQQFYNQLGLTQNVFNGTASESELRIYYSRTIDPIVENIIAEFTRKFLTKTARTQGQVVKAYRDFFKIVPIEQIAQLGDTFRRNGIASSNELRRLIGLRPSDDPKADELFNPNIADKNQNVTGDSTPQAKSGVQPGSITSPDNSQNGDNTTIGG